MTGEPEIRITVSGSEAVTTTMAAHRTGRSPGAMREAIRYRTLQPAAYLDGRTPLYLAAEIDAHFIKETTMDTFTIPTLPDGIHAQILTAAGRYGQGVDRIIVWADRINDTCPRCQQQIPVTADVPAALSTDGTVEPFSQQHGCGEWNDVAWLDVAADEEAITRAAQRLAGELTADRDTRRASIAGSLRRDLQCALIDLTDDPDTDVATGSDAEPGIYHDGTQWVAWAYGPDGAEDVIQVAEEDLRA
jgi:hypothetical protein